MVFTQLINEPTHFTEHSSSWLVDFNPSKTETMILSRKRNKPLHPNLLMDSTILNEVETHKHLGLMFSQDCSWHAHIEEIVKKAWRRINILRAFKFKLDRDSLERMYISFIRPLLEYGGPIWSNCTKEDKTHIESIQTEGMRILTGATKLCSIAKLYEDTGWETFQSRRNKQKLQMFYKMVHGLAPSYLNNLVPPLVQENSQYPLRNARNMQTLQCNTNLLYVSFLPSAIRSWNNLSDDITNLA